MNQRTFEEMPQNIQVVEADLELPIHQQHIRKLTAAYALDPMGNNGPLPEESLARLIDGLRAHPTTVIFLACVDDKPVGIATCFRGFSTFAARPLLNIHDLAVLPEARGVGIGRKLLQAIERKARELDCCKLTLEVQENNARARRLYERTGFSQAVYGETTGGSLFYTKVLTPTGDSATE